MDKSSSIWFYRLRGTIQPPPGLDPDFVMTRLPRQLTEPESEDSGMNDHIYNMSQICEVRGVDPSEQIQYEMMKHYVETADCMVIRLTGAMNDEPVSTLNGEVLDASASDLLASFAMGRVAGTTFIVDVVCVHSAQRKGGEGRAMIEVLKSIARANGCTSLSLSSLPSARGFYEKLGFHSTGGDEYTLDIVGGRRVQPFTRKTQNHRKWRQLSRSTKRMARWSTTSMRIPKSLRRSTASSRSSRPRRS